MLRIEFNVRRLYLGTGNHCTVVEQIKGSEAEEESVLQHPSLAFWKRFKGTMLVSPLELLSKIKWSKDFKLNFSHIPTEDLYIVFHG